MYYFTLFVSFLSLGFHHKPALGFSENPVLLISLDGLGWQYTGSQLTTNLDHIGSSGIKAKLLSGTPTRTWPTHTTWITGLHPESHGLISDHFWDPLYQENFTLQYDCSNFDPKFYNESEPLWLTVQKRGGKSGVHFWPGFYSYPEKPSYVEPPFCLLNCSEIHSKNLPLHRNKTRIKYPPYIHCFHNRSIPLKDRVDKVLSWLTADEPPKFVAFYSNEPDSTGHVLGIASGGFVKQIGTVDEEIIGYFISSLKNAGLLEKVNIIVVSDHSLLEISSDRVIYLSDFVDPASIMTSEQGVVGHIWPCEGLEDEVYANLTRASVPHMRVYWRRDIPDVLRWKHNRRIPPIYIDTDLGWSVRHHRPAVMTNWTGADHGWSSVEELAGLFYARGPAFKRNYQPAHALRSIDVYPLLCHLLGMKPLPNNGTLDNMRELLMEDQRTVLEEPHSEL